MCPLPLEFLSQSLPHPTPLGCCRVLDWAPCDIQQLPTSCLFYIWYYMCFNATLSICLNLSFPYYVHKSVFYVCVSIPTLQTGLLVPFFLISYMCVNIYIWLSFSDLLQFVQQLLGSSTSLELAQMHSFLWLSNSIVYMYHKSVIHSSVDGHLACLLASMSSGYCKIMSQWTLE